MDRASPIPVEADNEYSPTGRIEPDGTISNPQEFMRKAFHCWYNFVMGYSDQLVAQMLDKLKVEQGQRVLDSFCGTGTTLVECRKWGIDSVGVDANPFSCFVSRVKTNPYVTPRSLKKSLERVEERYGEIIKTRKKFTDDPTYQYLSNSGMMERGWICPKPLRKALALKHAIRQSSLNASCRNAMLLALVGDLPTKIANMKFGPEIYCGPKKGDLDPMPGFQTRVSMMIEDLEGMKGLEQGGARVHIGDSRDCNRLLGRRGPYKIDAVITSPPYPTEHDYTRNTRLELAMLEFVSSAGCIRAIKQNMIRSHTKGVYITDRDCDLVADNIDIQKLVKKVKRQSDKKNYGFARLYPVIVQQYFGGMKRHLTDLAELLEPRGPCALVLGDQASYLGVKIPTASILATLAEETGFVVEDLLVWRKRWATTTSKKINENILILRKRLT